MPHEFPSPSVAPHDSAMTRRDFLRSTTALAAAAFAGRATAAEARIGLGFSLYGMKTLPIAEAVKVCAEIGYDSVELALLDGFPTEPTAFSSEARKQLRAQLATVKLRVAGLMDNLSLAADAATQAKFLERIKRAGGLAHDLAPDSPPPLETVLGGKPAEWETIKDSMAANLRAWAAAAAEAKVVIAIKGHIMSAVQTPDRVLWLMRQADSPWIRVTYDYSHFQLQGLALDATLAELLPHTRFLHVKDGRKIADGKFEFLLPGEGDTDYRMLFAQLRTRGYGGDAVVEVSRMLWDKPGYDPITAAKKSFTALDVARRG